MFKCSFIWISASTNTIHWAKSEDKASHHESKYLVFPKNEFSAEASKPSGELKGHIVSAVVNKKSVVLTTMTGDSLEFQVNIKFLQS
jgi:hypothetical protein